MKNQLLLIFASVSPLVVHADPCESTAFSDCIGEGDGSACKWCWVAGADEGEAGALGCVATADAASLKCLAALTDLDDITTRWTWINDAIISVTKSLEKDLATAMGICTDPKKNVFNNEGAATPAVYCPFGADEVANLNDWSEDRCLADSGHPSSCIASTALAAEGTCNALGRTCEECTSGDACNFLYGGGNIVCTTSTISGSAGNCCSDNVKFDDCSETCGGWCFNSETNTFRCNEPEDLPIKCLSAGDVAYLKDATDGQTAFVKAYEYAIEAIQSDSFSLQACLLPSSLYESAPSSSPVGKYCPETILGPCQDVGFPGNCVDAISSIAAEVTAAAFKTCPTCTSGSSKWVAAGAFCSSLTGDSACTGVHAAVTYDSCVGASGAWCVKDGVSICVETATAADQKLICLADGDAQLINNDDATAPTVAFKFAVESSLADPISACLKPGSILDPTDATSGGVYCPLKDAVDLQCQKDADTANCVGDADLTAEQACWGLNGQGCEKCTGSTGCKYDSTTGICSTKATIEASACKGCAAKTGPTDCTGNCAWAYRKGTFVCEDSAAPNLAVVDAADITSVSGGTTSTYAVLVESGAETNTQILANFCVNGQALLGADAPTTPTAFKYLPFETDATARCVLASEGGDGIETVAQLQGDEACAKLSCQQCVTLSGQCWFKNEVCSNVEISDAETVCPGCNDLTTCASCLGNGGCCWTQTETCDATGGESCKIDVGGSCPEEPSSTQSGDTTSGTGTGTDTGTTVPDGGFALPSISNNGSIFIIGFASVVVVINVCL